MIIQKKYNYRLLPDDWAIKILGIFILLMLNTGCQKTHTLVQASSNQNIKCPDKPTGSLNDKYVKQIQVGSQTIAQSGQVRAGEYLAYAFEAKSGQRLNRQTKDDICIWVYSPDNQIITSKDLSQAGKYIIQVSAPQGSTSFDLKLSLEDSSTSISSNQTSPNTTINTNISTSERPSSEIFVKNHYIAIQNRQYDSSFSNLSSQFINDNLPDGYSEYQQWWNSVREIKIGNVTLINQSNDRAIVSADLWYSMNNGKTFKDSKNRIYLIWSNDKNRWLFDRKSEL